MKIGSAERPTLFYGFRLRHAVALLVALILMLVLAGYLSVSAGQKAALRTVTAQGRALTETLISSADMVIESDNAITRLAIDNLIGVVNNFNVVQAAKNISVLETWKDSLNADKVALIINRKIKSSSSTRESFLDNSQIQTWIDSLYIDPDAEIVYDFQNRATQRYLWAYFALNDTIGLFAAVNWRFGQYGNENLSLYYLLNEVGRESGIEYIMLQNRDGIVFASKMVAAMPKIDDDPFLLQSLSSDTTRSRLLKFEGRNTLETVRNFRSRDFEGIFRVGLSLYNYQQVANGMRRQVWLVVGALLIIGIIGFGIIVGFQNFEILKSGFNKAQVIAQSLLDSIPGPVIAIDSELKITDINSMARERFGITAMQDLADYTALFTDDPFHFDQVLESKRIASFEKTMGDGKRQYFVTTTPLIDATGETIGAIAIAQDITDAKKIEMTAESRRRLSELGALAASMAHEIRNPLNAIGITIQRMRNEIQPESDQNEYQKFLDGLKNEIKRLNDIIEKFLAVARAVRPEISNVNVKNMIAAAMEIFSNQAISQKVDLRWRAEPDIFVECDRSAVIQVLVNLIKNSLEALGSGGKIDISAEQSGEIVKISVIDDGPGISDPSLALRPFYTTKRDGTGLGLATASKIMADHGGELVIESSSANGCRIDLHFRKQPVK